MHNIKDGTISILKTIWSMVLLIRIKIKYVISHMVGGANVKTLSGRRQDVEMNTFEKVIKIINRGKLMWASFGNMMTVIIELALRRGFTEKKR